MSTMSSDRMDLLNQHNYQQRVQQVADAVPDIVCVYDLNEQRVTYTNRSLTAFLGYEDELWPQANPFFSGPFYSEEILHPDDVERVLRHQQQLAAIISNEVFELEYRVKPANGGWYWLRSRSTVFAKSQNGAVQKILVIVENITHRKHTEAEQSHQTARERLISRIAQRIHQSLDLQEILNTTVEDVRHFLQTDRVLIYRFAPNWSGTVAVESVGDEWISLLDVTIKDNCFAGTYAHSYRHGRIRAIDDIYAAGLAQCHIDLLSQFQVRANLVLPILQGDKLWGLLIAHHCRGARQWLPLEMGLLQELATQVAIAIQQSELYQRVQLLNTQLEQQVQERTLQLQQSLDFADVLRRVTDRIRDSLDESQILQTVVQELVSVLKVDYCCALLYNLERTAATVQYESSQIPLGSGLGQVLAVRDTIKVHERLLQGRHFEAYERDRAFYFQTADTGDLACPDLFDHFAAKLLCPIFLDPTAHMGDPAADRQTLMPFGTIGYLAVIDQTCRTFSEAEIKLVKQVANQCAIAVRQARLYQASQAQVEALEQVNLLKDDFLSTVSHELRTPVASMKLAIQMLTLSLASSALSEKTTRYLRILYDQCEREISLINDLLDLQHLEQGGQPLTFSEINLPAWVVQLVKPFHDRVKTRNQQLQVECPDILPRLLCDASNLERILVELLTNACKYSPSEALIKLSIQAQPEAMVFQVSNSGVEIPAQERSRIFDKFYRIPNADPWKQGGTGLGLALVQKLVDRVGGSILADSAPGQTWFTVQLPL